ncbi:cellulose biosynthesis protein BcsR [Serratia sp. NPDC078593]|uniref:cellulose biosynthesis protein BcsR n=1 Tax=unclassified Serratia (in: enterobacteria) TaxID=2647522 RepID=UPI0037D972C2
MNNQITRLNTVSSSEVQDDLQALSQAFSLPPLRYVDISRQERLAQMMARWPLLAELSEQPGSH